MKELKEYTFEELVEKAVMDIHMDLMESGGKGFRRAIWTAMETATRWYEGKNPAKIGGPLCKMCITHNCDDCILTKGKDEKKIYKIKEHYQKLVVHCNGMCKQCVLPERDTCPVGNMF